MINLLPPEIKEQIAFSKRNARLLKLIMTLGASAVVLGGLFFVGLTYLRGRNNTAEAELKTALNAPSTEIEKTVQSVNRRLSTVKTLGQSKHRYSALLRDIGSALPAGTYVREIALTGDDKPVKLNVIAPSYAAAGRVRDSLANLKSRILAVDIESINGDSGNVIVTVKVAFIPGKAK